MNIFFKTQILPTQYATAERLAMDFIRYTDETLKYRDNLYIAFSGGNTPQIMFEIIAKEFPKALKWDKLHLFWVDERCVPFDSNESNFGTAKRILFDSVAMPIQNLHPIVGNNEINIETVRYTGEILSHVPCIKNFPIFDLIMLGLGDDGHTASIFPGQNELFDTNLICAESQNPYNHQNRITLTGKVINNATNIVFLVTGKSKKDILKTIFNSKSNNLPAQKVKPIKGTLSWYLDKDAAELLTI